MADKRLDELPPHDRRGFFAAGLARLLRPLADYVEEKLPVMNVPPAREHIRPPGAMSEDRYLLTCYRCGSCADSCPAQAISILKTRDEQINGTPHIDPNERACTVCAELACMSACPSGALKPTDRFSIRMGLARVDERLCTRTHGGDCRICVDRCPIGATAITIDARRRVRVIEPTEKSGGCIGCGVCQEQCPTRPVRAIRVRAI